MNCPVCSSDMIEAKATSFGEEYWYCRSCKKELYELLKVELAMPVVSNKESERKEDEAAKNIFTFDGSPWFPPDDWDGMSIKKSLKPLTIEDTCKELLKIWETYYA